MVAQRQREAELVRADLVGGATGFSVWKQATSVLAGSKRLKLAGPELVFRDNLAVGQRCVPKMDPW